MTLCVVACRRVVVYVVVCSCVLLSVLVNMRCSNPTVFFTVPGSLKIHHGGASWRHLDHVGPSWDHLGATLKHLVGFENGDFTSQK